MNNITPIGVSGVHGRYEPVLGVFTTVTNWLRDVREKFGAPFAKRCGDFFEDHAATLDKMNGKHLRVMNRVVLEMAFPLSKNAVADHLAFNYDYTLGEAFKLIAEKDDYTPKEALKRVKAMLAAAGDEIERSAHPHIDLYIANKAFDFDQKKRKAA